MSDAGREALEHLKIGWWEQATRTPSRCPRHPFPVCRLRSHTGCGERGPAAGATYKGGKRCLSRRTAAAWIRRSLRLVAMRQKCAGGSRFGCHRWAECGTPTPEGYRRLCGEHYAELRTAPELAGVLDLPTVARTEGRKGRSTPASAEPGTLLLASCPHHRLEEAAL
jgi:hypothetical protein